MGIQVALTGYKVPGGKYDTIHRFAEGSRKVNLTVSIVDNKIYVCFDVNGLISFAVEDVELCAALAAFGWTIEEEVED